MRDPKVEQFLDDEGYEWEYVEALSFDRVTLDYNPARWQEQLDEDRVVSIGIAVERKQKMPAIVVAITATPQHALLSGRHRIEGCRLVEVAEGAAYVVTTVLDNYELEFMPYALNNIEGRSPTRETKLRQAAYFLRRSPDRNKTVLARRLGLRVGEVEQYIKLERAHDRAVTLNVLTDLRKMPEEVRVFANETLKLDAVFSDAVKCIAFIGMPSRSARALIKDLVAAPSEERALEMLKQAAAAHEELLKRLARKGRKKGVHTPDQIWFYAARATARKWPEHPDPKSFTHEDLLAARDVVMDLRTQCNEWLDKAMEALATWERSQQQQSAARKPGDGVAPYAPG